MNRIASFPAKMNSILWRKLAKTNWLWSRGTLPTKKQTSTSGRTPQLMLRGFWRNPCSSLVRVNTFWLFRHPKVASHLSVFMPKMERSRKIGGAIFLLVRIHENFIFFLFYALGCFFHEKMFLAYLYVNRKSRRTNYCERLLIIFWIGVLPHHKYNTDFLKVSFVT